jgi:hypothetical protein
MKKLLQTAGVVFGIALAAGLFGAGVGFLLGRFAPGFYRTTIPSVARLGVDPVEVGVGLGFSQGLILGAILAVIVALIAAWRERNTSRPPELDRLEEEVGALRLAVQRLQMEQASTTGTATVPVPLPAREQIRPR